MPVLLRPQSPVYTHTHLDDCVTNFTATIIKYRMTRQTTPRTRLLVITIFLLFLIAVFMMYCTVNSTFMHYGSIAADTGGGTADTGTVKSISDLQIHNSVTKNSTSMGTGGSNSSNQLACKSSEYKSWRTGTVTRIHPHVDANCALLWNNTESEVRRVQTAVENWKNAESDKQFISIMKDCSIVTEEFTGNFYVSQEEMDFPLAFSLVVYTAPQQVIRLLKTIYRPHNLYCIHPDARQSNTFISFFTNFSKCFDNVFVASRLERVYYAHSSILEAQLHCMEDFIKYDRSKWRYAINLVGQELPLATNRGIVKALKQRNSVSIVQSFKIPQYDWNERFVYKYDLSHGEIYNTYIRLPPIPHNITIYKSSTYIAITRQFMEFILGNEKAVDFRNYLQDVRNAEESFYASLFHLPEAATLGGYQKGVQQNFAVEKAIWLNSLEAKITSKFCSGRNVHNICIVSFRDLHHILKNGRSFFFNKYFMEWDNVVMDCAEERLIALNRGEYRNDCLM